MRATPLDSCYAVGHRASLATLGGQPDVRQTPATQLDAEYAWRSGAVSLTPAQLPLSTILRASSAALSGQPYARALCNGGLKSAS